MKQCSVHMGEISKPFPQRTNSRKKIIVLKGTCLWRLVQKKCLFETSLHIPSFVPLRWNLPSLQLNLCFPGLLSSLKSWKHYEKKHKCQSRQLAEGNSSRVVHPLASFLFQLFSGTHKSKAQLAARFLKDDNSAIIQMSKSNYPDLVFKDLEQTLVSGKNYKPALGS